MRRTHYNFWFGGWSVGHSARVLLLGPRIQLLNRLGDGLGRLIRFPSINLLVRDFTDIVSDQPWFRGWPPGLAYQLAVDQHKPDSRKVLQVLWEDHHRSRGTYFADLMFLASLAGSNVSLSTFDKKKPSPHHIGRLGLVSAVGTRRGCDSEGHSKPHKYLWRLVG